ncbi:MAG: SdpI family protein [Verrucomicrobiota bacterium]
MTLILGLTHLLIALLTIGLSIPLIRRRVQMNQWYGVRIPRAFESDDSWYKVNQFGGKCLLGWSLPILLIGIGLVIAHFKAPISPTNLGLVTLFSFTPLLLIGAWPQTLMWTAKHLPPRSESSTPKNSESDQS